MKMKTQNWHWAVENLSEFPLVVELFPTRYSKPGFFHLAIRAASSDVATAPESHKKF